jgi:hypothetical protein
MAVTSAALSFHCRTALNLNLNLNLNRPISRYIELMSGHITNPGAVRNREGRCCN